MATDWSKFTPDSQPRSAGVDWSQFKPIDKEAGDVSRGFKTSFEQLPQLGYGLMAGVGAAAENLVGEGGIASGIKKAGVEGYQRWGEKIAGESKESDSLSYSWNQAKEGNFGALVDWFQYGLGYAGGQALQMLATAGVGAIAGKATLQTVAKEAAKGMVMKEAAAIKATEAGAKLAKDALIAQATKNVASKIGMTTAVGAQSFGMEGGEIFGDLVAGADQDGRQLTGDELAKAFGATLAAGGLEFVGDKFGLDVMLGKSKIGNTIMGLAGEAKGVGGRVARGALGAAVAAPVEGATEYFQTGIEQYGKGKEENPLPLGQSEESQRDAFDAAGLGAVGGFAMGGGAGILSRAKDRQEQRADQALSDLANAKTADEMIGAATRAVDVPIVPGGIDARAEDRALSAMERMARQDANAIRFGNTPDPRTNPLAGIEPQEPSATVTDVPPFGDRVLDLREQLADERTREQIRERLGPEALDTVSYYASVADRADINMPEKTRERLLTLAESIVSRALLQEVERPAAGATIADRIGMGPGPARIGLDTAPTGVMRVDAAGNVAPETRADAINTRQATQRADGMVAQQPRGAEPAPKRRTEPEFTRADRAPRAEAVIIEPAAPNAVAQYVDRMRGVNTLAARAFVSDFEAGRITPQDVLGLMTPRAEPTADERIAAAAAQAPKPEDGLLLTADGSPYGTKSGATIRARREGLGTDSVIEVPGGYAVRTQEATSVQPELPSASSGVSGAGADGAGAADAGGGAVRPVAADARGAQPVGADAAGQGGESDLPAGDRRGTADALTPVLTRFGGTVYVRQQDLEGDRDRMRYFTSTGKSRGVIVRDNLDPDGSKQASENQANTDNPLFDTITAKNGAAFATEASASRERSMRGLGDGYSIEPVRGGFVLRRKKQEAATPPAPNEGAQPQGDRNGQEGRMRQQAEEEEVAGRPAQDQAAPAAEGPGTTRATPAPATTLAERVEAKRAPTREAADDRQTPREVVELRKRLVILNKLKDCLNG